jgi:hypothetical protein
MAVPAYVVGARLPAALDGRLGDVAGVAGACAAGGATFLGMQALCGSPELRWLTRQLRVARGSARVSGAPVGAED